MIYLIIDEVCVPKFDANEVSEKWARIENDVIIQCWNYCTMFEMEHSRMQIVSFTDYPTHRHEIRYGDEIVLGWIEMKDCKIIYSYPKF